MSNYKKGFVWNDRQKEALEAIRLNKSVRHVGLWGGSRSGKSFVNTSITKIRASKAPGSNHVIGRSAYSAARKSIVFQTMPDVDRLVFPDFKGKWYDRDGFFAYPNDAKIWIGGWDKKERIDKILGNEYSTIQNEETSELTFDVVENLRGRLAETCEQVNGTMLRQLELNSLNPTHVKHWSYIEFIRGLNPSSLEGVDRSKYYSLQMNPQDNSENLSPEYLESLAAMSPLRRKRFKDGEYKADNENAIWQRDWIDEPRVTNHPHLERIVIAADPSGGGSDIMGIVVAGRARDASGLMHFYVLHDGSKGGSAPVRFEALVNDHDAWHADTVIGETNFGGDMVEKSVRDTAEIMMHRKKRSHIEIAYKPVVASRGKVLRAEPVSNLYYQHRVHHVGSHTELEDEMCQFTTDWNRAKMGSPNRVDAVVFAISELMTQDEDDLIEDRPEVEYLGM